MSCCNLQHGLHFPLYSQCLVHPPEASELLCNFANSVSKNGVCGSQKLSQHLADQLGEVLIVVNCA